MNASLTTLSSFRSVESVEVEIAPGELIDKITILEIKMECITANEKKTIFVMSSMFCASAAKN